MILAAAATGLALQWNTYLNHDLAWILYSAGRMLEGAEFGRDVIAANPPLVWFMSMPVILISDWLAWPIDGVFRAFVTMIAVLVLLYCDHLFSVKSTRARIGIAGLLAWLILVGSNRDFGQREHLSLILALPYLFAAMARSEGRGPRPTSAIIVGIAAGLAFALKPYFLAVPLLVEGSLLLLCRAPWSLLRAELVAMTATVMFYVAAIVLVTPEYLTSVVPMMSGIYWGFSRPISDVILRLSLPFVPFAIALGSMLLERRSNLVVVLLAATVGYGISYLAQGKGYTYHALPVQILALAAAGAAILSEPPPARTRGLRPAVVWRLAALVYIIAFFSLVMNKSSTWYSLAARPDGKLAQEVDQVIQLVDLYASGGSFLAISTHPFPGFPTALYTKSRWGGRTNSQVALPAAIKIQEEGVPPEDPRRQQTEALARAMLLRDLSAAQPALVLVDAREKRHAIGATRFDILDFYVADPAIGEILRHYRELPAMDGFRLLVKDRLQ